MDIIRFYQDHGIQFQTEGHKHCRSGWVNIPCPFCTGNPGGLHLGYSITSNYFTCWRCGGKSEAKVITKLLNIDYGQAKQIIRQYGGRSHAPIKEPKHKIRTHAHKLPSNVGPLQNSHRKYLIKRKFDPDKLVEEWNLQGTGPISILDGIDYGKRILAPIIWNGKQVSFQARDITDQHKLKYMACPKKRELIEHQTILYGDQSKWGSTGICVEGITDVWRFGIKSFAVFGIDYTLSQVKKIRNAFDRVVIVFDDDPQAIKQAQKLKAELNFCGVKCYIESVTGDPGGMDQDEADHLVKQVTRRFY
jgi:hypothetical protein